MPFVVINFRERCADGHYADRDLAERAMWRWKKRYRHEDFYVYETKVNDPHPLVMNDDTFMPRCYRQHGVKF